MTKNVILITHGKVNPHTESGMSRIVFYRYKYVKKLCPNIKPYIFSFVDGIKEKQTINRDGVEITMFPRIFIRPLNHPMLKELNNLADESTTLVDFHLMWFYDKIPIAREIKKRAISYVVSAHGAYSPDKIKVRVWKKIVAKYLYELRFLNDARGVLAQTPEELSDLRSFGVKVPIYLTSIAIDSEELKIIQDSSPIFLDGQIKLAWIGNIRPIKNLHNLILAFTYLPVHIRNTVKLYIIGPVIDKNYFESLKKIIQLNKLNDQVIFLGPLFKNDKYSVLKSVDGYIHCSTSETISLAVLEAMAAGKPCILARTAQVSYLYNTNSFIMVEPWADHIAIGIKNFAELSISERIKIGERAKELVYNRFLWEKVIYSYLQVVDSIL
ncbi:MAG: glycosyltransferase [Nitrososphaeria archaeon]